MADEFVASWPIIPFSAVGLCAIVAAAGLIALLYDMGARDTGKVTQLGVLLLGVGILGCLGIGLWNVTVSIAHLTLSQNVYASAPSPNRE